MVHSQPAKTRLVPMARDGWRFVLPLAAAALICMVLSWHTLAAFLFFLAFAAGWFFRDFHRVPPKGANLILAPADGFVGFIDEVEIENPDGEMQRYRRVSIVLSIFNVHIQRAPLPGRVLSVRYNPGKFLNAFDEKSSSQNENNMIWIQTAAGPIAVKQIAGLVARRIVCWCKPGKKLGPGQRVGLIRFGSRTEVFFPLEARLRAHLRQKVQAGLSILAEIEPSSPTPAVPEAVPAPPLEGKSDFRKE